ncbi:hypothetical protein NY536_22245, partial [Enterobacter hormaechei]|nr:hypothetical protein [Enterobacter hormaechei]
MFENLEAVALGPVAVGIAPAVSGGHRGVEVATRDRRVAGNERQQRMRGDVRGDDGRPRGKIEEV